MQINHWKFSIGMKGEDTYRNAPSTYSLSHRRVTFCFVLYNRITRPEVQKSSSLKQGKILL